MPTATISRRHFLGQMSGIALAAPALLAASRVGAAPGSTAFWQPPLDPGRMEGGVRVFDLSVAAGQTEFFAGHATDTIGINGPFLGPQLLARAGDRLRMNVGNNWAEPITLHWHGLHLPAAADGGPHQAIAPGDIWTPEFTVKQKAGSFWYHGHQHHRAGPHVWAGMAGLLRIEDDEEAALPLPRSYGEDDFSLVLQDRSFDADFQMPYRLNMHSRMAGLQGDRSLVNGRLNPVLQVAAPRIRLRLLNGSNGSIYRLHFADDRRFWQIASDGGLLAGPVAMSQLLLAPAERAEIIVDLDDGAATLLRADVFGAEAAFAGSSGTLDFIEIRPDSARHAAAALPARLAELAPISSQSGETRTLRLATMGGGMMGDFTINDMTLALDRIDFAVPVGAVETWVIENKSQMLHPMHIHDVQFRILSRNGQPPEPREAGLKDTVLVAPGETVALRLSFADYTDPLLPYMFHCHILEHEDAGMMGQFTVI